MKKLILIILIVLLFSLSVQASIIATIGMKGLSFIDPKLASVVGNVMSLSDPTSFVQGQITGKIKQETIGKIQEGIMQEFSKDNPGAVESMNKWNQVKGYIDQGANIVNELKLDDKGKIQEGSIKFDKLSKIGSLINNNLKDEDIQISKGNMNLVNGVPSVILDDGGSLNIKGKLYMNIEKDAKFKLDTEGNLLEANFKSKGGEYYFDANKIKIPAGASVNYKNGILTVSGANEFDFGVKGDKDYGAYYKIKGENVVINGNTISGDNFEVNNIQVYGLEGKATLSINTDKRYTLYANSVAKLNGLSVKNTAEKGNVNLYLDGFKPAEGEYVSFGKNDFYMQSEDVASSFSVRLDKDNNIINLNEKGYLELSTRGKTSTYFSKDGIIAKIDQKISSETTIINGNNVFYSNGFNVNYDRIGNDLNGIPTQIIFKNQKDEVLLNNKKIIFDEGNRFAISDLEDKKKYVKHSFFKDNILVTKCKIKECYADNIYFGNKIITGKFSKEDVDNIIKDIKQLPDVTKDHFNLVRYVSRSEMPCKDAAGCILGGQFYINSDIAGSSISLYNHEVTHIKTLDDLNFISTWRKRFGVSLLENIKSDSKRTCFTYYGCTNILEDMAETVTAAYDENIADFTVQILKNDIKKDKFILMCAKGFIDEDRCDKVSNLAGIKPSEFYRRQVELLSE